MSDCTGTIIQQVQCAVRPLADKIGQGAKYLWGVNYRQTIIEGITELGIAALLLVIATVAVIVAVKYTRKAIRSRAISTDTLYSGEETAWTTVGIASAVLSIILTPIALTVGVTAIQKLLNPGYFTIQRILHQVTGGS